MECLELVGLEDYARRLPSELSGGQQQRVAIARALANDPPVLVADEPTGNLDSKTALQVFDLLETLTGRDKTVIFVTHDRDLAARAHDRLDLLDGRIVAGTSGNGGGKSHHYTSDGERPGITRDVVAGLAPAIATHEINEVSL